jgi:hypothetical protein
MPGVSLTTASASFSPEQGNDMTAQQDLELQIIPFRAPQLMDAEVPAAARG